MSTRKDLLDEIESLKNKIDDLQFELEFTSEDLDDLEFTEEDAASLLKTFKKELERKNLWTKEMDETLDLFIKFDLPLALNNIIN